MLQLAPLVLGLFPPRASTTNSSRNHRQRATPRFPQLTPLSKACGIHCQVKKSYERPWGTCTYWRTSRPCRQFQAAWRRQGHRCCGCNINCDQRSTELCGPETRPKTRGAIHSIVLRLTANAAGLSLRTSRQVPSHELGMFTYGDLVAG